MKKNQLFLIAMACLMAFAVTACGDTKETETETESETETETESETALVVETAAETKAAETETEEVTEDETDASETDSDSESEDASDQGMTADDFLGTYVDSYSNRAEMTIEQSGKADMYNIDITWGSDAAEYTEWNFTCTFDPDQQAFICSGFAECSFVLEDPDGEDEVEEVYSDQDAVISYVDGEFVIDDCDGELSDCHFVQQ